jgi:hypothetical protein
LASELFKKLQKLSKNSRLNYFIGGKEILKETIWQLIFYPMVCNKLFPSFKKNERWKLRQNIINKVTGIISKD